MRKTLMHFVISRRDQPDAGMRLVSLPLVAAKNQHGSLFNDPMVAFHMETRSKAEAQAFLKEEQAS